FKLSLPDFDSPLGEQAANSKLAIRIGTIRRKKTIFTLQLPCRPPEASRQRARNTSPAEVDPPQIRKMSPRPANNDDYVDHARVFCPCELNALPTPATGD